MAPFDVSNGLAKELKIRASRRDELLEQLGASASLDDWTLDSNKNIVAEQTRRICQLLPVKARVLDVGFGVGFSSMELGRHGFSVTGVEPSPVNIEIASRAAEKFGLNFTGVLSTAEEMTKSVSGPFDAVYFNSSLHHCDDPQAALHNAYTLLADGGLAILVEPTLKPWRSKAWFFKQLEANPIVMGHYGGNEHIYYNWEYVRMLQRAGFAQITYSPILAEIDLRSYIVMKVQRKTDNKFTHSLMGVAARASYYTIIEKMSRALLFSKLFKWLSLGDGLWTARRAG
jgi:2-polyprenyl-3-methyl-5-hydroxy-6-metoxy-1,4-benzoquinol methylase